MYHLMTSLIKRPSGDEPRTMCLHAEHLASTHAASLVVTLPSSRYVGRGNQLQTGIASWSTAHVAHTCPEKLKKQPSEVAAVSGKVDFMGDPCTHCYLTLQTALSATVSQAGHGSGLQMRQHMSSEIGDTSSWASSNVSSC